MIPSDLAVAAALREARLAARKHMATFESAGEPWYEVPVTQLLLAAAYPVVKFASFTQPQEATTGGDWLWWWLDDQGEAFGMVVQAKRLLQTSTRWNIDFDFNGGAQRRNLVQTGLDLEVAPMYAIYQGTSEWRGGKYCKLPVHIDPCDSCERSTISLVPAIVADFAAEHELQVEIALEEGLPLESIADPSISVEPVWDVNLKNLDSDLLALLREPQYGARRVARMVFERVAQVRAGQFSAAVASTSARAADSIFDSLPEDYGHFRRPYYPEILDGLRRQPPSYILDLLSNQDLPDDLRSRVGGVAVFAC